MTDETNPQVRELTEDLSPAIGYEEVPLWRLEELVQEWIKDYGRDANFYVGVAYESLDAEIRYSRLETPKEVATRLRLAAQYEERQRAKDLEDFESLKARLFPNT